MLPVTTLSTVTTTSTAKSLATVMTIIANTQTAIAAAVSSCHLFSFHRSLPHCSLHVTPPREELLGPDRNSLVKVAVSRDVVDQVEGFPLHPVLVRRSRLTLILL